MVKHPLSQIASYKRVKLWPPLLPLSQQHELMTDYFPNKRESFSQTWTNSLIEASLFWKAMYKVLLSQADTYPDWLLVIH